ncbi:MAG: hypothetical protein ACLVKO_01135 [Dysgonomonas sp.]
MVNAVTPTRISKAVLTFNDPEHESIIKTRPDDDFDKKAEIAYMSSDGYLYRNLVENGTTKPSVIRLSVESLYKGSDAQLQIEVGGNLIKSITLVDKVENTEKDVTNGGSYVFQHRYNRTENGKPGLRQPKV